MTCFRSKIFLTTVFLMITLPLSYVSGGEFDHPVTDSPRAITFDDLISMGRLGSFEISPDGEMIAFTVTWFDKEDNSSNTDIYMVPVKGGDIYPFARSEGNDYSPCWSPDGKRMAFVSDRDGDSQIWTIPLNGGEAHRVTEIPTGVSDPVWSPDGKTIAFSSRVYPDCENMECNREKLEKERGSKVSARLIDHLLFRHWNHWRNGRWSHLFLVDLEGGEPVEINKGRTDVPPISLGGEKDYCFSPDGKELCFAMNPDPVVAVSTNNDLFITDLSDGTTRPITAGNLSNDNDPRYSPDGRYIAYRAQMRPGSEADRFRLMLYDRKNNLTRTLTEEFDYSVSHFVWAPDNRTIWFNAQDKGRYCICKVSTKGNDAKKVISGHYDTNIRITPDGRELVTSRQTVRHPADLYRISVKNGKETMLTDINRDLLADIEMNPAEEFWFEGAEGRQVHGMIVKPPFFEEDKKYPLILLIHGGPQGAFGDDFHYRWNIQMFASPGYVVATINFTGSTGYGQAFTDAISGDWGGAPYTDIMEGMDYILDNYPYIDSENTGAAGASYGGYMVDWIEGHTDRFSCLVSHAGVYNLESMYGATEELWFPEWEFKGMPWTNPETYSLFSPHRFVNEFKTPCLVVHGEGDYRVPYTQGLEFFTALQRKGVPSKLLFFPDEDHFVRKPQNAEVWWNTLHEWFDEHLKNDEMTDG